MKLEHFLLKTTLSLFNTNTLDIELQTFSYSFLFLPSPYEESQYKYSTQYINYLSHIIIFHLIFSTIKLVPLKDHYKSAVISKSKYIPVCLFPHYRSSLVMTSSFIIWFSRIKASSSCTKHLYIFIILTALKKKQDDKLLGSILNRDTHLVKYPIMY